MATIKVIIPLTGPWEKPTITAAAPPRYGPIYGIKSVIPQNIISAVEDVAKLKSHNLIKEIRLIRYTKNIWKNTNIEQ